MSETIVQPETPNENPLADAILNAKTRSVVYALFGMIGLVLGAIAIALIAVDKAPQWYVITAAVYNFLSPFFSGLARSNVNKVTA
jgi:hypothetical protein